MRWRMHATASKIPSGINDAAHAAPLLCAGLIGYRALASPATREQLRNVRLRRRCAHGCSGRAFAGPQAVYAFTRPGDAAARSSPRGWAPVRRRRDELPPKEPLDAAIVFAPVGSSRIALRAWPQGRPSWFAAGST